VSDSFSEPARGGTLGRFLVLDRIGDGGMGVVYRAYDPDLDRRVAIKVLRPPDEIAFADEAAVRLLREAQAMAKLSHPNVVPIYEVGTRPDGRVFLVMEYIDGGTLASWQTGAVRTEPEIVAAYVAAGRGLAAAHAAGIVHRDFKPENVFVRSDGRILVGDFGLVGYGSPEAVEREGEGPLDLTRSNALLGTPRYMSPEQHQHRPATPRSDQFAFAVSLWTALAGEPPFAGDTYRELVKNTLAGAVRVPQRDRRFSGRSRSVLERALSVDPAARFADLPEMLSALSPGGRRRAWWIAAAAVAIVGAVGVGAVLGRSPPRVPTCSGGPSLVAKVWNPGRATGIRAQFSATGLARAPAIATSVEARLGDYASRWVEARHEVCEATRVRGEQSEAVMDLRMTCLDQRMRELDALAALVETSTANQIDQAISTALKLTPLDVCDDVAALSAVIPPPTDPSTRTQVDALAVQVAQVKVRFDAGRYADAVELGQSLVARAAEVGYRPLRAELMQLVGASQSLAGDPGAGRVSLEEAAYQAEASRHDAIAARAWTVSTYVAGFLLGDVIGGEAAARRADAAILRLGNPDEPRGRLELNLGALSYGQGKTPEAIAHWERALALWTAALGPDDPELARVLNNVGSVYGELGRDRDAIAALQRAVHIWSTSIGERHPFTARARLNLGMQLRLGGALTESIEQLEGATRVLEELLGPEHDDVMTAFQALSTSYLQASRLDDAWTAISRVAKVRGAAGEIPPITLLAMSAIQLARGEAGEAEALTKRALAQIESQPAGPARVNPGYAYGALAEIALKRHDLRTARADAIRSITTLEAQVGRDAAVLASPLMVIAEVALASGKVADATEPLARAVGITRGRDPVVFGRVSRILAEQQWQLGYSDQARATAAAGRALLAAPDLTKLPEAAALDAWLAAHSLP
jgi:tetratricopeptide (TPR) repeat protein/predicted Ser/Thr protein kinase